MSVSSNVALHQSLSGASAVKVLLSEDGQSRVTLQDETATLGLKSEEGDGDAWVDWRSCAFKTAEDGVSLELIFTIEKGNLVDYCKYEIKPDFEKGTFVGNLDYEE